MALGASIHRRLAFSAVEASLRDSRRPSPSGSLAPACPGREPRRPAVNLGGGGRVGGQADLAAARQRARGRGRGAGRPAESGRVPGRRGRAVGDGDAVAMSGRDRLGRGPVIAPGAAGGLGLGPGAGGPRDAGPRPRGEGLEEDREATVRATVTELDGVEPEFGPHASVAGCGRGTIARSQVVR